MRAFTVLCLSVLFACAGAQRPASDSPFDRVSTTLSDIEVGQLWRISFELPKAWAAKTPQEAKELRFVSAGGDAVLALLFDPGQSGDTAAAVAGRLARSIVASAGGDASEAEKIEFMGVAGEAWFALRGTANGIPIVVQGRVRAVAARSSRSWLVLIAMSPATKRSSVTADMAHATSTATFEPIAW